MFYVYFYNIYINVYGGIDVFKFILIYILFEGELLNVFK